MSQPEHSLSISDPVASREFLCVRPSDERFSLTVQLGRPVLTAGYPEGAWRCAVTVPLDGRVRDVYGVDSWQALKLALSLVHSLLADFLRRGGKLYYPGTDDEFTLDEFDHGLGPNA